MSNRFNGVGKMIKFGVMCSPIRYSCYDVQKIAANFLEIKNKIAKEKTINVLE